MHGKTTRYWKYILFYGITTICVALLAALTLKWAAQEQSSSRINSIISSNMRSRMLLELVDCALTTRSTAPSMSLRKSRDIIKNIENTESGRLIHPFMWWTDNKHEDINIKYVDVYSLRDADFPETPRFVALSCGLYDNKRMFYFLPPMEMVLLHDDEVSWRFQRKMEALSSGEREMEKIFRQEKTFQLPRTNQ